MSDLDAAKTWADGQAGKPYEWGPVNKIVTMVPVSRESLLDAGLVEPTPEEAAQRARRAAEAKVRTARYEEALTQFRREVAERADLVATAVLELHVHDDGFCRECDDDGCSRVWPCETVGAVARVLGVEVPEW